MSDALCISILYKPVDIINQRVIRVIKRLLGGYLRVIRDIMSRICVLEGY